VKLDAELLSPSTAHHNPQSGVWLHHVPARHNDDVQNDKHVTNEPIYLLTFSVPIYLLTFSVWQRPHLCAEQCGHNEILMGNGVLPQRH
jgi:hypothetical protein